MQDTSSVGDRVLVSCISACGALPLLPRGQLRPVPRRRRMDPRSHDRRHPGRERRASRSPTTRRTRSRTGVTDEQVSDAGRHPADRLRGRRPERPGRSPATRSPSWARARSAWRRCWAPSCSRPRTSWPSTWPTAGSRRAKRSAPTSTVRSTPRGRRWRTVAELTDGLGADVTIEAVGIPETFEQCPSWSVPAATSPTSVCTASPAHAAPRDAVDQERHDHDGPGRLRTRSRRCSRPIQGGQLDPTRFTTHRFPIATRRWTRTTRSLGRERPTA